MTLFSIKQNTFFSLETGGGASLDSHLNINFTRERLTGGCVVVVSGVAVVVVQLVGEV